MWLKFVRGTEERTRPVEELGVLNDKLPSVKRFFFLLFFYIFRCELVFVKFTFPLLTGLLPTTMNGS